MRARNALHLGVKELGSLARDPMMLVLIAYAFTASIYSTSTGIPDTLNEEPIAIVDEDQSPLSRRIVDAFRLPYFLPPLLGSRSDMDADLDAGLVSFALNIRPHFQRDVLAGRSPTIQLNTDATRIEHAFTGSGYVQTIVHNEVQAFVQLYRPTSRPPVELQERVRYNPNLTRSRSVAVMLLIDNITILAIVLTGAALIRERERGTVEHLLAMPVTPLEIMTGKLWSMGLVVLGATAFSVTVVVQGLLAVPIRGSIPLFLCGAGLHLFAATSLGMLLATYARTMPQYALLLILVLLPLQMLSGGATPRESMPEWVQTIMLAAPTTHFVKLAQGILYRGAGLEVVWPQFLALVGIGAALFGIALARFRRTIETMA